MSDPVRIWLVATHHSAFLNGGWAFVWTDGSERRGAAGGERRTTREKMAVAGLAAALRDLPKGAPVVLHAAPADGPVLAEAIAGADRPIRLVKLAPEPKTPLAFAAAWADLASDKAKMAGAFNAAIPKPNLAKILGL
jgi:hypothetical protein